MQNNDLISRSALLDSFDAHWVTEYDEAGFSMEYKAVPVGATENAPAVDAEPVRHGEWLDCENYNDIVQCSKCGLIRNIYKQEGWNYCPNCGAKMDVTT